MANNVPAADAASVARVKGEHGVMLGKTNLSEWANVRRQRGGRFWIT